MLDNIKMQMYRWVRTFFIWMCFFVEFMLEIFYERTYFIKDIGENIVKVFSGVYVLVFISFVLIRVTTDFYTTGYMKNIANCIGSRKKYILADWIVSILILFNIFVVAIVGIMFGSSMKYEEVVFYDKKRVLLLEGVEFYLYIVYALFIIVIGKFVKYSVKKCVIALFLENLVVELMIFNGVGKLFGIENAEKYGILNRIIEKVENIKDMSYCKESIIIGTSYLIVILIVDHMFFRKKEILNLQ